MKKPKKIMNEPKNVVTELIEGLLAASHGKLRQIDGVNALIKSDLPPNKVGLLIGIASPSATITYLVGFFSGAMAGRLLYERKNKLRAPYLLIIIGFIIGYVIGTFYGDKRITFLLFIFGAVLTYYLFDKGILRDTRY